MSEINEEKVRSDLAVMRNIGTEEKLAFEPTRIERTGFYTSIRRYMDIKCGRDETFKYFRSTLELACNLVEQLIHQERYKTCRVVLTEIDDALRIGVQKTMVTYASDKVFVSFLESMSRQYSERVAMMRQRLGPETGAS